MSGCGRRSDHERDALLGAPPPHQRGSGRASAATTRDAPVPERHADPVAQGPEADHDHVVARVADVWPEDAARPART